MKSDATVAVLQPDEYLALIVRGEGCGEHMDMFIDTYGHRIEEGVIPFLMFARDWFRVRDLEVCIRPSKGLSWCKRKILKFMLKLIGE